MLVLLLSLISRLNNHSGLRISHCKVFSSGQIVLTLLVSVVFLRVSVSSTKFDNLKIILWVMPGTYSDI